MMRNHLTGVIRVPFDNHEVRHLAAELMRMTGDSLETVLISALHGAVERERTRLEVQERIMDITREIAERTRYAVPMDQAA